MSDGGGYRVGEWRFDPPGAILLGPRGERRLEDRAARTLTLLCRRRGETITHSEILAEVWQGRAVSPNSIAVVVADLRRALDDDARDPVHIATVAKRGYRLNNPVVGLADRQVIRSAGRMPKIVVAAFSATALAGVAAFGVYSLRASHAIVMLVEPVTNDTGRAGYDPLCRALGELVINRIERVRDVTVVSAHAVTGSLPAGRPLRLSSRLILWNGVPTLSLAATDRATGSVVWTAMAAGPADALAGTTIEQINALSIRSRTL